MKIMTKPAPTLDEFLAWEREQELAYEFDGERIIEMNGETPRHALLAMNVAALLHARLDRQRYFVFPAGVKVVHGGRVQYPDVIVAPRFVEISADRVPKPEVVFEIISPTSRRRDSYVKSQEYGANESIRQYVILEQDAMEITSWVRQGGGGWAASVLIGPEAELRLSSLELTLALKLVYEDVVTEPAPPEAA